MGLVLASPWGFSSTDEMADTVFGIYGFDFSEPFTVSQAELVPRHGFPECRSRAQDRTHLFLTGYGIFPEGRASADIDQSAFVRRLADGMTFCQQQMVTPTRLIRISAGDSIAQMITSGRLPESLPILSDRHTPGEAIGNDTFYPGSRALFLELFLAHTERASADHPLTAAFYRQIEIWKLSQPYVEIEHFLAFPGLEILARAYGADPNNRNVAVPLSGFLQSHGFAVPQALVEDWAAARNALFHCGQLETTAPGSGNLVRITDQLYALGTLLADASLKHLGFDDGHVNWARWQDRMPFR